MRIRFVILTPLIALSSIAQTHVKTNAYLFPGQGADYRLFNNITLPHDYDTVHIHFPTPNKGETMNDYAKRFIPLIDTNNPYILIGVSLGGMICTELSTMLKPDQVIIISSAKCWKELPGKYSFQRNFPLNRLVPRNTVKIGAILLQPIVEPDSRNDRHVFYSMLSSKDSKYLKRTVNMIIHWEREQIPEGIFHIHGTSDNTIPFENVTSNYTIKNGSHMMVYTMGDKISVVIQQALNHHP